MGDVTNFKGMTKQPLPVERVLTNEDAMNLTEVVVLGWAPDGSFHFAGSEADLSRALMLLACAQRWITDQYDLQSS